jgi:hippurate hydrolase
MFIAQPAEEVGAGAMAMLMEGLFTRFPKPNFGFALHANGAFAHGTVLHTVGAGSSNYDGLHIKFRPRGSRRGAAGNH